MARRTKQKADRAKAPDCGDYGAEGERGFDETCDKARRERSREIIEAEIERLALLPSIDYAIERKAAADRLDIGLKALDTLVKAKRPKKAVKSAAPQLDPDELQRSAADIINHRKSLARSLPAKWPTASCFIWLPPVVYSTSR
jgi:hypothetical protein